MAKAKVLTEAMPYIRQFAGKTLVIKYGGSAMVDDTLRSSFARDITLLGLLGLRPVVVHGGGPHISRAMARAGIEPRWVDGLRVTDEKTLGVVRATLGLEINPDIVRLLEDHGADAKGFSDLGSDLLVARQLHADLGFVGKVVGVNTGPIRGLLNQGVVPVLAPLARGSDGHDYNINADTAAGALAAALGARKLIYLTDVEGLYRDLDDEDSLIEAMFLDELRELLGNGSVSAGMLPKLRSCIRALEDGVPQAHILDGRIQHAVLLEVFTPEGIGTMITPGGKS
ncbi:MAG: acetylglutamate kinase [bacterium]|nr:acetylglutamate kinase [bacterium]MDE0351238.1 acetylglutamate kinase [bacterium]